jgi:hypothetical protein
MQAQEGDTLYTDNDQIDKVEEKTHNGTSYYKLSLKEKWGGYVTSQKVDNILRGVINTLAAKEGRVSDVTEEQSKEADGENKFYTSWMKVINPSSVGDTVETNQICVIIYGDSDVPAGKNFKPCELMTIARWGCDAEPEASGLTPAQKADIERRQRIFSISTTDGRIAKLRGVRRPILEPANYGTTLGIVPDFINQWSIASRLKKGRDYLYAQGVIVGDFIKVNDNGDPLTNYVDCGDWQDNTPYLHEAYNSTTLQWETNDVWHNGSYWRCKVTQPYQGTYYEPTEANSLFWEKLLKSGDNGKTITTKLTIPTLNIPCDASGNSKASGSKDCYVTMYVDGTAVQTSAMTLTVISKPTSITVQTYADVSQISKNRLYIIYPANVARNNLEGNILFSISDGTNTTYSSVAVTCSNDGQQGAQGKTGRFFYYGKEFNTSNTDTFSATDTEAPFFYYNSNYWLYKGENFSNKTITQIQSAYGAPSNSNDNWAIMVSDFKYLITEAIFGTMAHFGSAIINGDWLLSQHGTINGVASTDYQAFDPSHPNDNTGSNFIPNYCVDLFLGKSYQNDAVIRGTIMADNLYHGVCFMSVRGNNNSVFFCNTEVRNGEGQLMRPSFYTFNEAWSDSSWYINHLFEEGKYYTAEEIRSISNNDIGEGNGGFTECSGYCDTVYVLPTVNNSYPTVFLPRPEDVQGKCVDVFAFQYGTGSPATFYVSCCNLFKGMTSLIYYDEEWKAVQSTPERITCETNVCMRFMSTKVVETSDGVSTDVWYWLAAPYFKQE